MTLERQTGSTSKTPLITPSASPPTSSASLSSSSSPFKRPRLSSSRPPSHDSIFDNARDQSTRRMLNVWSHLAERYSRRLDEDDIIDLVTGQVVKDRGVLRNMENNWEFGRFADSDPHTPSESRTEGEEEDQEEEEEQTHEEEESDDELDSFADLRRTESQIERGGDGSEEEVEAEDTGVSLPASLPTVRALDPEDVEDAADLQEFLEAESRRKGDLGSEEEDYSVEGGEEDDGFLSEGATTDGSSVLGHATPFAEPEDEDGPTAKSTPSPEPSDDELAVWEADDTRTTTAPGSSCYASAQSTSKHLSNTSRSSKQITPASSPTKVSRQLQTPPNSRTPASPPGPHLEDYFDYVEPLASSSKSSSLRSSPHPHPIHLPTPSSLSPVHGRQSASSSFSTSISSKTPRSVASRLKTDGSKSASTSEETPSKTVPRETRSTVPHLNLAEVLRAGDKSRRSSRSPQKPPSSSAQDARQSTARPSGKDLHQDPSVWGESSRPLHSPYPSLGLGDESSNNTSVDRKGKQKATAEDLPHDDSVTLASPRTRTVFDGVELARQISSKKRKRGDSSDDDEIELRSARLVGSGSGSSWRSSTPMPQRKHEDDESNHEASDHSGKSSSFFHHYYDLCFSSDAKRESRPQTSRSTSLPHSNQKPQISRRSSKNIIHKGPYPDDEKKASTHESNPHLHEKYRSQSHLDSIHPYANSYYPPYPPLMYDRHKNYPQAPVFDPRAQYIISQAVHQLSALFSNPWVPQHHDSYPPPHHPYMQSHEGPSVPSAIPYTPTRGERSRSMFNLSPVIPSPSTPSAPSSSVYHTPTHRPHPQPYSYDPAFSRGTLPPSSPEPDSSPVRSSSPGQFSSPTIGYSPTSTSDALSSSPVATGFRRASSLVSRSKSRGRRVSFKKDVTEIGDSGIVVETGLVVDVDVDVSPRPRPQSVKAAGPSGARPARDREHEQGISREDKKNVSHSSRQGKGKGKDLDSDDSSGDEPLSSVPIQRTRRGLTPGPSGPGRNKSRGPPAEADPPTEDVQKSRGRGRPAKKSRHTDVADGDSSSNNSPVRGRTPSRQSGTQKGLPLKNTSRGRSQSRT
ncbi:hypothetical protein D9758_007385 [Tetrapyrgos nigripes]|uniref:Uncharacterized protein n=1 Tax=Tetrapyrgos nigripes TaxID=182062 RepID=A0A8H5GB35_9AGAR|nr:hypothetical protein D9758_007385 [Tetrapyrgos nigripes]